MLLSGVETRRGGQYALCVAVEVLDQVGDDSDAALGAARDGGTDHVALARLVRAEDLEPGAEQVCGSRQGSVQDSVTRRKRDMRTE